MNAPFLEMIGMVLAVLLIAHLVLLFKWDKVRRPSCFLMGCASLIIGMLVIGIFGAIFKKWSMVLTSILVSLTNIAAFGSLIWAVYAGPTDIKSMTSDLKHTMHEAEEAKSDDAS